MASHASGRGARRAGSAAADTATSRAGAMPMAAARGVRIVGSWSVDWLSSEALGAMSLQAVLGSCRAAQVPRISVQASTQSAWSLHVVASSSSPQSAFGVVQY